MLVTKLTVEKVGNSSSSGNSLRLIKVKAQGHFKIKTRRFIVCSRNSINLAFIKNTLIKACDTSDISAGTTSAQVSQSILIL